MTPSLFFGTFEAPNVGIPRLLVGCDKSLDEYRPVIRLRGENDEGTTEFDHVALALSEREFDTLLDLARDYLAGGVSNAVHRERLTDLVEALERATAEAERGDRLRRQLHLLERGERLVLADEGTTTISRDELTGEFYVYRWGFEKAEQGIGQSHDVSTTAAIALGDAHLQRTDPVVSDAILERTPRPPSERRTGGERRSGERRQRTI